MVILLEEEEGGEIDEPPPEFILRQMRIWVCLFWLVSGWAVAQTGPGSSATGLSDLPSVEAKPNIPGLDKPVPAPDLSGVTPPESLSIPQLRPPAADPAKTKAADDSDWAAQAMLQKKEEAKKKRDEEATVAAQKAKEAQEVAAKEKLEKKDQDQTGAKTSTKPAVAESAVPGFGSAEAQKLPAVTGFDGVKPRAMPSGDGRVQPGFDSYSGPSSSSPLGKDFQSGAKPIMPGTSSSDGRMQMPPKAPEPPSGGYKRISQDPYTIPPNYGENKPSPTPAQPKLPPKSPPVGNPLTPGTPAGLSPYDNNRKVPDPRSQRRF